MNYEIVTRLTVKCGILLFLLMNGGCMTHSIIDKATSRQVIGSGRDTIDKVTAAYVTNNQELIVCVRGFYEGSPPAREYAFRIPMQLLRIEIIVPPEERATMVSSEIVTRDRVVLGCPYLHKPSIEVWKSVAIQTFPNRVTYDQRSSLRPLPGTQETVYEVDYEVAKDQTNKQVFYTTTLEEYFPVTVIEGETVEITRIEEGQPLLYLLLPFTMVTDVVGSIVAAPFLIFCYYLCRS
jgi:hypothetical protein